MPEFALSRPEPIPEKVRKLITEFSGFGPSATIEDLERLIIRYPQTDDRGKITYLISGGFAADLATRESRPHRDLDIVVIDSSNRVAKWIGAGVKIDSVKPEDYFGHMRLSNDLLIKSCLKINTKKDEDGVIALIVHPAIVLVQKLSDFYGKAPRLHDLKDAYKIATLAQNLCVSYNEYARWSHLIQESLTSVPASQFNTTFIRVCRVLEAAGFDSDVLRSMTIRN